MLHSEMLQASSCMSGPDESTAESKQVNKAGQSDVMSRPGPSTYHSLRWKSDTADPIQRNSLDSSFLPSTNPTPHSITGALLALGYRNHHQSDRSHPNHKIPWLHPSVTEPDGSKPDWKVQNSLRSGQPARGWSMCWFTRCSRSHT